MKNKIDYTLYLCTDRGLMSTETVEESVELAIKGGCTVVQLREKDCSSLDFYNIALNVKKITDEYNVPLIINDRIDIALAVDAAGVHIGQSDLPASIVRKIIGNDKIIGVSAATVEEAVRAKNDGADYLGIGAMYTTNTKKDTRPVTIETLKEIRKAVNIPLVVIGGINKHTVPDFKGTDIDGIAVISAIIAEKDIEQAARDLLNLYNREVRRK
ncbi:MAG: thiamine phosphate synthase [Clostridium sp.]|nr:thiamine phosphate synthase [Clostridium sp.]MDY3828072.1 thiamine phosphate synthase [Clostridium sp.]